MSTTLLCHYARHSLTSQNLTSDVDMQPSRQTTLTVLLYTYSSKHNKATRLKWMIRVGVMWL